MAALLIQKRMFPIAVTAVVKSPDLPNWPELRTNVDDVAHYFRGHESNLGALVATVALLAKRFPDSVKRRHKTGLAHAGMLCRANRNGAHNPNRHGEAFGEDLLCGGGTRR